MDLIDKESSKFMYANRGMYAETIVNRTIEYYLSHYDLLLEKRNIPMKIIKEINDGLIIGKLLSKSTVDYSGFINNQHIEFEVKQTEQDVFNVNAIKEHQYIHLQRAICAGVNAFVIVHFTCYDEFYLLKFIWIEQYVLKNKKKAIYYKDIQKECTLLNIVYPGILNLKEKLAT